MTEPTDEKKPARGGPGQKKTASVGGLYWLLQAKFFE